VSMLCACSHQSNVDLSHQGAFGENQDHSVTTQVRLGQETAETVRRESPAGDAEPRTITFTTTPWRFAEYDGHVIATDHFVIHTTVEREDFRDQLPLFYEQVLAHYTSVLGTLPMPDQQLETYLFQDRRQWQAKTRQLLPDQANIFNTLGRGGFTTRGIGVLYYIDHRRSATSRDTFAIAAHEGWHQYTQRTFRHHLPVWLEEGLATYMESFSLDRDGNGRFRPWTNNERRFALARAVREDNLIPLRDLLSRSPQSFLEGSKHSLLVYYAQVWALTRFLAEGEDEMYREALEQVLHDAAHGKLAGRLMESQAIGSSRRRGVAMTSRTGPWIILEYFNSDFDAFEEQYMEYVQSQTQRRRW